MAMEKRTIWLSDDSERVLEFLSSAKPNVSGTINSAMELLHGLIKQYRPELSEPEWEVLCDTYKDSEIKLELPVNLARDVMAGMGVYDISTLEPEAAKFIKKLSNLSEFQQIAILWRLNA